MKRMLMQLAGGYAGLGALAFLVHRARYLSSSQVRDFTDRRSHELLEELDHLRSELRLAQRQLRATNQKAPPNMEGAKTALAA
ncbi:MAG TPA: hypothetical protein VFN74_19725 [Chloroflexota bacterium]|nr:hypothetical protein [Chloroflexota bacterium]